MLITWRNFNATTGPVEYRFDYQCERCGTQAPALVRTVGSHTSTAFYGAGGSARAAQEGAVHAAYANAVSAMRTVACPACHAVPPAIVDSIEAGRVAAEKRRRRRFPVVAIATGITLALGAVPAAIDLRSSSALVFAALSTAVLVGSLAFLNSFTGSYVPTLPHRGDVWFWWHQRPYQAAWTPAPAPPTPTATAPGAVPSSKVPYVLGWVTAIGALIGAIASFTMWSHTFLDVYVVEAEGRGDLKVIVDGKTDGAVPIEAWNNTDVPFAKVSVRRGRKHEIAIVDGAGGRQTFTVDKAADDKQGWVIAPDASKHDLCIIDSEIVYGSRSRRAPEAKLLNPLGSDAVIPLEHSADYDFQEHPASISTEGSEVRKRTLRGYVCSELAKKERVPFRSRKGPPR